MKLTPEQLREIAERAEQAEEGPWEYLADDNVVVCNCKLVPVVAEGFSMTTDGIFIAASRTDIPRLLAHIAALEKESKKFRLILSEVASTFHMTDLSYEERMRKMEQIARDAVYDYHEGNLLKGADNSKEVSHE